MLNKLHQNHTKNDLYVKPKSDLSKSFGINHFAGPVFYNAKGFLEKNRDQFGADLLALVQSSKFKFLTNLFDDVDAYEANGRIRQTVASRFRKFVYIIDIRRIIIDHSRPSCRSWEIANRSLFDASNRMSSKLRW